MVPKSKPRPPKNRNIMPISIAPPEACDRCGYSRENAYENRMGIHSTALYYSSSHLSDAAFEVVVISVEEGLGNKQSLYFCAHHYQKFETHIAARGYQVIERARP